MSQILSDVGGMIIFAVFFAAFAVAAVTATESDVDGLVVKTIKEAKSCDKKAEIGDRLKVHYVGRLENEGGKIFDESRPRGQTFDFTLGVGQVIVMSDMYPSRHNRND